MKKKFKRGTKVRVVLEGIVLNEIPDAKEPGVRISVKKPKMRDGAWWSVVPMKAVKPK